MFYGTRIFQIKWKTIFLIATLSVFTTFCSYAQLKRKPPGQIDKEAPDIHEELHQELHDIKARERQSKATRVYTDMNRISLERKKNETLQKKWHVGRLSKIKKRFSPI